MTSGCDEVPDSAILHPIAFNNKGTSSSEWHYNNIEHEASWILHGLEKFHYYCFMREVCIITDHKPYVGVLSKNVVMLP